MHISNTVVTMWKNCYLILGLLELAFEHSRGSKEIAEV